MEKWSIDRRCSRPTRPNSNPLVKSLDAWMAAWVLSVASSCFDSLVPYSVLELCLYPPLDCAVRGMTSWFSMDEPLRSGNRPKPQHWKSDESTEVEGTSAEEDQVWNDDSDADWTINSEGRSSLSGGSVCALASDGQASLKRSISEINSRRNSSITETIGGFVRTQLVPIQCQSGKDLISNKHCQPCDRRQRRCSSTHNQRWTQSYSSSWWNWQESWWHSSYENHHEDVPSTD